MNGCADADEWVKTDLHIHTLDDQKDALDYTAHQLLERAKALGFRVLAITLHDSVFDRQEVFADAASMGILLIPAAEVRLGGADIILLNVRSHEVSPLKTFDDVRRLRATRGESIYTFAPHPFYLLGGSIGGARLEANIDCFDAIEVCHFHIGWFDRNRPAREVAARCRKQLLATSDAHQLRAFGSHYTSIPASAATSTENVFDALRAGRARLTSPPCSLTDLVSTLNFLFVLHPLRQRRRGDCRSHA
ncbi:MAG: PHP domain-containing protein [Verrucomicrobiota bacterium]|nr:PHP domain-containing protein [Verrucomicrobiota bacterium]